MKELQVRNRQRARPVNTRFLRTIATALLEELLAIGDYAVGVHLVGVGAMADLNEKFLQHSGPTDVITFDLREHGRDDAPLFGEIYICMEVAVRQANEFHTTWQSEVVRYVVHGVLHLLGYDDLVPAKRKIMKQQENRLVRALAKRFDFAPVAR